MSRRTLIAPVLVLLFLFSSESRGALITPPGLNPGDQFRFVFVTSDVINAISSDIGTYDSFVSNLATNAGLDTYEGGSVVWRALVSLPDPNGDPINARDRLPGDGNRIFLVNNSLVLEKDKDLWTDNLDSPINRTETGDLLANCIGSAGR